MNPFLSQPVSFTFFPDSPSHPSGSGGGEWGSGCMVLSCWLGLNHDKCLCKSYRIISNITFLPPYLHYLKMNIRKYCVHSFYLQWHKKLTYIFMICLKFWTFLRLWFDWPPIGISCHLRCPKTSHILYSFWFRTAEFSTGDIYSPAPWGWPDTLRHLRYHQMLVTGSWIKSSVVDADFVASNYTSYPGSR